MFDALFITSLIGTVVGLIKESFEPEIPAKNWANKEGWHKDIANGISIEERMKKVKNGEYKIIEKHPEPHKDTNGKIIIENSKLYHEDLMNYSAVQVYKWVEQGKYNLTLQELELERKRIEEKFERLFGY